MRDLGQKYSTNDVANATITVQTKPLFSTISKLIKWSNPQLCENVNTDQDIVLNKEALTQTLKSLDSTIKEYTPTTYNNLVTPFIFTKDFLYNVYGKSYMNKSLKDVGNSSLLLGLLSIQIATIPRLWVHTSR